MAKLSLFMKDISIIIATYNAERYIERCLYSIIQQKNESIELIIIDGKSNDNTIMIIEKYIDYIDKFISEEDKGLYDAWNKGLDFITGKWVQFLGADDMLLPNSINMYQRFLNTHSLENIDCISAKAEYVNAKGKLLQHQGSVFVWNKFRRYMCISHGSTLHRRALYTQIGKYNTKFKICADYELLLRKKDKLSILFFNKPVIKVQAGGMSMSLLAHIESFKIKRYHKTTPLIINIYHFVKGIIGLVIKRIIWDIY